MKFNSELQPNRLIIAITGASGASVGIRLLERAQSLPVETHLIVSNAGRLTIEHETGWQINDVLALADVSYDPDSISESIASGSFYSCGMIIVPCSIKTLSAVANSYAHDLIARSADVTLKEGRTLILAVREAPLHRGHLRLMSLAAENGAIIFPLTPSFYNRPDSVDALVDNLALRILARLGFNNPELPEWRGLGT